jgi:DNA mismatch endonuclease (patch repair protein)
MRANRRRDTGPELALRSALHRNGLRFRVDLPLRIDGYPRPIRPDVVFTRARLAVFVDGCWWHGCDVAGCRDAPRAQIRNWEYWTPKIQGNRDRDRRQTAALEAAGWTVLRFWSHEDVAVAAATVLASIRDTGSGRLSQPYDDHRNGK